MQDLTLVGVHDDGEHLVLAGAEGQRFRVRVDEPLRAAVRRDRPRLGQLQIEQDGRLRPRDIQARIRSGESAEQIAADSGVAIEHIRRYEGPVLAEREFVVRQARAVRLRGVSRLDGTVPTLGELVTERLAVREVEHGEGSWDAWRTEDGTWIVTLAFTAGTRQRQAQWAYNAQLRHVTAQDDEARWLTENETPGSSPGRRFTDDWCRCAPPMTTTAATSTSMTSRPTAGSARPSRPPPPRHGPRPPRSTCWTRCGSVVVADSDHSTTWRTSRTTVCHRQPTRRGHDRTRRWTPRCSPCPSPRSR